ncbi:hypothetical protein T08_16373 [Trichinella sp. T8]|nr:hypothetical protein T08_16373 [Trichinella sp. T8]
MELCDLVFSLFIICKAFVSETVYANICRSRSEKMYHHIPDNFKWKVFSEILISKINDSQYK